MGPQHRDQPPKIGFIKIRRHAQSDAGNFKFDGRRLRRLCRRGSHRNGRKDRSRFAPRCWSAHTRGQLAPPEIETGLAQAARAAEFAHRDRLATRTPSPLNLNEDAYKALLKMLRYEVNLGEIEDAARLEKTVMEVADARNKAGEALGNAPLTPAQRLEVSKAQQIYAHEPAPEKRTAK